MCDKITIKDICNYMQEQIPVFNSEHYIQAVKKSFKRNILEVNHSGDLLYNKLDNICDVYKRFLADGLMSEKEVVNNLNRIIIEEGMVYEAIGYYWLMKTSMRLMLRPLHINANTCSGEEVVLDGEIENAFAFDIKKFQTFEEIIRPKLSVLEEKYGDYVFFVQGQTDISKDNLWSNAVQQQIERNTREGKSNFTVKLPNSGEVSGQKKQGINCEESNCAPVRWCENNYKFALSHCGQFTTDKAFVQIELFDLKNLSLIDENPYSTLRILTRRLFFELVNDEECSKVYCDKIRDEKRVKDVIQYLSGVWFIDISTGDSWVFLNPFAKHKISQNKFEPYGWDAKITIDDFRHDNY